jgi:[ribosomal protein S5]-alanine N-acetyltransferase
MVAATDSGSYQEYPRAYSTISVLRDERDNLSVSIQTTRLQLRSVQERNLDVYLPLYTDPEVTAKYGAGKPYTSDQVRGEVDQMVKLWASGNPYSGFAIFQGDEFVGNIDLMSTGISGEVDLGYILHKAYWGQGLASEAAMAIVKDYAPLLLEKGYTLKGHRVTKIVATARPDNPFSCRILEKVGMQFLKAGEKYGAPRHFYEMRL